MVRETKVVMKLTEEKNEWESDFSPYFFRFLENSGRNWNAKKNKKKRKKKKLLDKTKKSINKWISDQGKIA